MYLPDAETVVIAFTYLFKEAMLLICDGCGSLWKLAAFLPQASPHILLLE